MSAVKVFSIKEGTTPKYTATLQDEDGTAIAQADITSITLTLYNLSATTRDIINSRSAQDINNTNQVTIHATSGLLTWSMQAADTAIQDSNKRVERHRALFVFTWDSGAKKGVHEVDFDVENIEKHT